MSKGNSKQGNKKVLPKQLYKLRPEKLQVGDVLASTVPSDSFSKIIRFYTGSDFSHVAVMATPKLLYEAADFGVLSSSPHRMFVADTANLAVFRPNPERIDFSVSSDKQSLLSSACNDMWLAHYGMKKAIAVAFPLIRFIAKKSEYFCSELVARAYANCGIQLVQGIPPESTTPRMVYESDVFSRLDPKDIFEPVPLSVAIEVYGIDSPLDLPMEESRRTLLQGISIAIQEARGAKPAQEEQELRSLKVNELEGWNDAIENKVASWVSNYLGRQLLIDKHIENRHGGFALKHFQEQYDSAVSNFDEAKKFIIDAWAILGPPDKLPITKRRLLGALQRSLGLQTISMLLQLESVEQLQLRLSQSQGAFSA